VLVSAVIPTFNRAKFIAHAVDSALAQDYPDLEIIVVDDGSTDETADILSVYRDKGVTVLSQANRGVSAARNAGIARAKGELVALLDSDDYWLGGKISRQVEYMLLAGYEICQTEEIWIRRGRRVNPRKHHAKPSGRIFKPSLKRCLVSPSCVMFTRSFWDRVGPFDESLPACEDYDLWLRAGLRYEVGLLGEPLTVKRGGHADQLSRTIKGLDLYRVYALIKILRDEALADRDRGPVESELREKARIYAQGCLKRGKPEEASRVSRLVNEALAG